jgi:uncharacterized protein YjbI with pentapeptide repeats
MTPPTPVERPKPQRPISWWAAALVVAIVVAISAVAYAWFADPIPPTATDLTDADLELAKMRADARRNALTVAAGLGGLAALLLAFRRQRHTERQQQYHEYETQRAHEQKEKEYAQREQEHAHQLADATRQFEQREQAAKTAEDDALQRRITDLRVRAVEQLGSDNPTVRIGGLHNLERLGQLHPELRQTVIDEICAYLRMPYNPPVASTTTVIDGGSFEPVGPPPASGADDAFQERQVRHTAQDILARHLRVEADVEGEEFWSHDRIDLRGAFLDNLDFSDCVLRSADFQEARFEGNAEFSGTRFASDAYFHGASFHGVADFASSRFEGRSVFIEASFLGTADFRSAKFSQIAFFHSSDYRQNAVFSRASFGGHCDFQRTRFRASARLNNIEFHGSVFFFAAAFEGGVSFRSSLFHKAFEIMRAALGPQSTLSRARFADAQDLPEGWKTVEADDELGGFIAVRT